MQLIFLLFKAVKTAKHNVPVEQIKGLHQCNLMKLHLCRMCILKDTPLFRDFMFWSVFIIFSCPGLLQILGIYKLLIFRYCEYVPKVL